MYKYLVFVGVFLILAPSVSAHSGRTDSSGGHFCRVGACAGTYHYHNGGTGGGSSGSSYVAPVIPTYKIPLSTTSTYIITKNASGGYNMEFDWDRPDDKQYSIAMSKTLGADPGPNTDTVKSEFTFKDVKPGKWYVNLKEEFNGYWSDVLTWTIELPSELDTIAVKPTPYPTPTPYQRSESYQSPQEKQEDEDTENSLIGFLGLGGATIWALMTRKKNVA